MTKQILKSDVQWVVARSADSKENDPGELGVKIGDQIFTLYKGESCSVYGGEYRRVGTREFGEVIDANHDPDMYDWHPVRGNSLDLNFSLLSSEDGVVDGTKTMGFVTIRFGGYTDWGILVMVNPKNRTYQFAYQSSVVASQADMDAQEQARARMRGFVQQNGLLLAMNL